MTDLSCLTDQVAVLRLERMRWQSKALRVEDRNHAEAWLYRETADVAAKLADEAAEIALFRYCANSGQA